MIGLLCFVLAVLISPKARLRLEAENASLRHQLIAINAEMMILTPDRWRQVARTPASLATFLLRVDTLHRRYAIQIGSLI
jgi:hypothetical protein